MMALLFSACVILLVGALRLRKLGVRAPRCAACVEAGDFVAVTAGLAALGLGLAMMRGAA